MGHRGNNSITTLVVIPEDNVDLDNFSLDNLRLHPTFAKLILGQYFETQDDYLDAFVDPAISRTTSARTPEHRKILDAAYGRKDGELEAKVKAIYEELQISQVYKKYEEKTPGGLKKEVFEAFLSKIYKRTK
ncbi:hypothetical protein V8E54_011453 [Elaphomyces granulatus]